MTSVQLVQPCIWESKYKWKRGRSKGCRKVWGNYIGGTDDSLTLLDYLIGKQKDEISLSEILADTGLD